MLLHLPPGNMEIIVRNMLQMMMAVLGLPRVQQLLVGSGLVDSIAVRLRFEPRWVDTSQYRSCR
jgi:hypothetical protein